MWPCAVSSTRSPDDRPWAAVSTYCTVPSSIRMPSLRIVEPPVAADGCIGVIDSMRPKPTRIAVGTTTGAAALGCTTTAPGGAVTTGTGATTTGAGAGVAGSTLAQPASAASTTSTREIAVRVIGTSC